MQFLKKNLIPDIQYFLKLSNTNKLQIYKPYIYKYNLKINCFCRDMVEFPAVTICNHNKLKSSTLTGTVYEEIKKVDTKYKALVRPTMYSYDYTEHDADYYDSGSAGEYNIYFYLVYSNMILKQAIAAMCAVVRCLKRSPVYRTNQSGSNNI